MLTKFSFWLALSVTSISWASSPIDPNLILAQLTKLPPLVLDFSNPKETIENLVDKLPPEVRQDFLKMNQLERKLLTEGHEISSMVRDTQELMERVSRNASSILENGEFSSDERNTLEGYKFLLQRGNRLLKRSEFFEKNPEKLTDERKRIAELEQQEKEKQEAPSSEPPPIDIDTPLDQIPANPDPSGEKTEQKPQEGEEPGQNKDEKGESTDPTKPSDQKNPSEQNQTDPAKSDPSEQKPSEKKPSAPEPDESKEPAQQKPTEPKPTDQENGQPEKPKDQQNSPNSDDPTKKKPDKLPPIEPKKFWSIVTDFLNALWLQTLKQYDGHTKLMAAIHHFRSLGEWLTKNHSDKLFLHAFGNRAANLHDQLEILQIQYKDLEDLALSFVASSEGTSPLLLRNLKFLDALFDELARASTLIGAESLVAEEVKRLLNLLSSKKKSPTDRQIGETFLSQLFGPLSRRTLENAFPSSDAHEELNWSQLAYHLRAGYLNDFLTLGRLRSYMNVLTNRSTKPKFAHKFTGPNVPINEAEPILETAQELDRMPYFYRDGAPPKEEFIRLLAGDMLENTFPNEVITAGRKKPIPKTVTIIAFDISGSMSESEKYRLRDLLMLAYIDQSQMEVVNAQADHIIYAMPFNYVPLQPTRISNLKEAQDYFDEIRMNSFHSWGGTNITYALTTVYHMIASHQLTSGEMSRANILLITDGEDAIDVSQIEEARKKIDPKVEIVMNAITIGETNQDIEKLVTQKNSDEKKLGRVCHHHIPYEKFRNLFGSSKRVEQLEEAAGQFDPSADTKLGQEPLIRLKQRLIGLNNSKDLADLAFSGDLRSLGNLLAKSDQRAIDPTIDDLLRFFLRAGGGPNSQNWSKSIKAGMLYRYIHNIAEKFGVEGSDIIAHAGMELRNTLLSWLE